MTMRSEEEAEQIFEQVSEIGDDTNRFDQEEAAEFYEAVAYHCSTAARALREEMT